MRRYKKGEIGLLLFNLAYLIAFAVYYLSIKNFEFLWYTGVVLFFIILIWLTLHKTNFDYVVLAGLSIWGFLHMAGGGIIVNDNVLYALRLLPIVDGGQDYFILKFDQIVHFFGFGVATLVMIHLLKPALGKSLSEKMLYFTAALAGIGLGALNEIVEFTAVVLFPETGVGGYFNTSLDLVFNMFGAIAAILVDKLRGLNNT